MMWTDLVLPYARRQDGLVTAAQCAAVGISPDQIKHLCRTGTWHRVVRGVYRVWIAEAVRTDALRMLIRAAVLSCGPDAVAVGPSAAHLFGLPTARRDPAAAEIAVPGPAGKPRRIQDRLVIVHQRILRPWELTAVDGIACTTPARTVADILLTQDRFTAICATDAALQAALLDAGDLGIVERMFFRRRGAIAARQWLEQVDGRAESPLETRGRLRCLDAGLTPDELQASIVDGTGRVLARADMLWRRPRLIAEADGASVHDRPEALFRDRTRQNDLMAAGYAVVRFTWQDTQSRSAVPRMVQAAMGRNLL
ncbi:MAG: DUF559 domain-containing protein [Hamadaea sp.]|nr:DUF559 domain-containing protein [Hamadaea sp.]